MCKKCRRARGRVVNHHIHIFRPGGQSKTRPRPRQQRQGRRRKQKGRSKHPAAPERPPSPLRAESAVARSATTRIGIQPYRWNIKLKEPVQVIAASAGASPICAVPICPRAIYQAAGHRLCAPHPWHKHKQQKNTRRAVYPLGMNATKLSDGINRSAVPAAAAPSARREYGRWVISIGKTRYHLRARSSLHRAIAY